MARLPVRLDSRGLAGVLTSADMTQAVRETADAVADNVATQGLTAEDGTKVTADVETYTTDRAAAAVTIDGPWGLGMQAKHGVLTKAAAAAGLEVSERSK
jgi:hypothetical protein